MDAKEVLMTPKEAADYLQVRYRVVLRWISEGKMDCYRIGDGRSIRIGWSHIEKYLKGHEVVNETERVEETAG